MSRYAETSLTRASIEAIEMGRVDWSEEGRVHNWRSYVGPRTRTIWPTLSRDQREAVVLDAEDRAGSEDWE